MDTDYQITKRYQEKQMAQGLCVNGCGRPLKTTRMCSECAKKSSYKNNRVRNKRRLELIKNGICSTLNCNKPLATKWLCEDCRKKLAIYARNWFKKDIIGNRKKAVFASHKERFSGLRPAVVERDKNTCQMCFDASRKIVVHHINENPKDNRMDNLICLCKPCHVDIERINKHKPDMRKFFYWFKD